VRDSYGISGTGETTAGLISLGGSPHAPWKASILERKSTSSNSDKITFKNAKKRLLSGASFYANDSSTLLLNI
jgi:hypothetical protein